MSELTWHYPRTLDELTECLKKNIRPHGGGTGLMRNPPRSGALADLSELGIDSVEVVGAAVTMGGAATFTAVLDALGPTRHDTILAKAVNDAASPALRNRITVGGSIALFPPWSSIVGPLVALDARVTLAGGHAGTVPITDYLDDRSLGERSAIVSVQTDAGDGWRSYWYRFARTHFNYPLFTVTVLTRLERDRLSAARIVITGNRGRYRRLAELEARVTGAPPPDALGPADLGTDIPDRQGFTGEYLTHLAAVAIARGLAAGGAS